MTDVTYPAVESPAEVAAASLCWLNRFKSQLPDDAGGRRIAAKVEGYWHDKPCRYCPVPPAELMARINECNAFLVDEKGHDTATMAAFKALPGKARTAKVREAQEGTWYDQLDRL